MIRIQADVGKNRLTIRVAGQPTDADIESAMPVFDDAIARLRAPFDVLSDIRELKSFANLGAGRLEWAVKRILDSGGHRGVWVVGRNTEPTVALKKVARLFGHEPYLAYSLDEAEQVFAVR